MTSLSDAYKTRQLNVNPFFSRTKSEDRAYAFNQFGIVTSMLLQPGVDHGHRRRHRADGLAGDQRC